MEVGYDSSARESAANIPGHGQAAGAAPNYFIQNDQSAGDTPQGISDDLESWNPMEEDFTNLAFNAYREPTTQELRQWMPKPGGGGPSEDLLAIYRSRDGDVRLFVNGIPNEMTQEGLQGLFSQVGKLVYCKVIPQRDPSRIDKFGFVGYKSYREAEHAIRKFDGFPLGKNMKLKVSLAKEKPKFPDTFPSMDYDDVNITNSSEEDSENKEQGWGPPATPLNLTTSMNDNSTELQGQGYNLPNPDQERQGITEASACNGEVGIQAVSKKPIGAVLEPLPCSKCGKEGRRRCGNCKIPYCSKECQRSHWPEHKTFCNWKTAQENPERHSAGTSAENTFSAFPSTSQTGADNKNENEEQSSSKTLSAPTQDPYSLNEDDFDISEISQFANLMGIRMVPRSPGDSPSPQNCELNNNQRRSSGSGSPLPSPQESHYGFLQPLKKASTKPLITEISSSVPEPVGSRGGSSRSTPVMSSGTSSPAISTQSEYQMSITSANVKPADEPQQRPHKRYYVNEVPHQNVSIGGSYEFVATSVSSPTLFWAQLYEESALASQNYLFETIKAEYENTPYKTYVPSPNELCIAQFSLDNNWYRSKVDYICNNGLIRVTHIDFGSSEDVDPTKIRRIIEDLVRVPRQGVKCALHFSECPEMSREWSSEEIQAFRSRVLDVKCRVEVKDIKDSVLQVNMFDSKDNTRINDIFKDKQRERASVVKPVPVYPRSTEMSDQLSSPNSINPHESSSTRGPLQSAPLRDQEDLSSSRGSSPAPLNITQAPAYPVTQVPAITRKEDPTSIPQTYSTNVQSNRVSLMLDSGSAFMPVQKPLTEPSGSGVRSAEPLNQESQSFFSEAQTSPETYYRSASNPYNSNPRPGIPLPEQESVRSTPSQSSSKSSSEVEFQVRSPESPMQRTTGVVHGLPFKGVVTSVKSPWEFNVNLLDSQLAEQFDQLTYELNKYCSTTRFDIQKLYTCNELCAARLKDDRTWHRGKVIASFEDEGYKVLFIDLGGEKILAPQNLRALPEQFQIVEPQCRVCSLGGVRKPAGSLVWGREASERFSSLVLHRPFTFKEINRYKNTYLVDVLNEAGQPSVAVELINAGLADPFIKKVQRVPDLKEKARPMATILFPLPIKFAITSAKLPPPNTIFQVMATDIQSPASFSVQLVDEETNQSLSNLCAEMNKYYADSTAHPDWKPRESEMCATFLKGSWFRAHIGNVNQDNAAFIYCVDFGNSEVVSTSVMRPLAPMFQNHPYCALRCSLGNIIPTEGDEWSKEATDLMKLRVPISSTLNARLIFKGQSILFLDVYVSMGKSMESIVKLLVAKGLAKFTNKKEISPAEMPKERIERNLGPSKTGISSYGLSIHGCAIAAAKLPNETETFQGIVTEMKPTGELYVQIADETLAVQLMELTRAMNSYYTNAIPTKFEAKQNLLCAAKIFTDWRRAYILGINSSETAIVIDVDFGKTETVPFSQLQFLQPQFMTLQYCALQCKVSLPRGMSWTKEACDLLVSKVKFHVPTTMRLISKRKEILFIDFLIAESNQTLVQMIVSQTRQRNPILEGSNRVPKPRYSKSPPKNDTVKERTVKSLNFERAIAAASLPHVGQTFDAVITEYQSPQCFYIQSDFEMAKRLETLSAEMNNYYNAVPKSAFQPVENQLCVALFGAPNEWYRALIEKINSNQTATIFYVDYGNTRDVPMADLRPLQDRFSELPCCALNTSLADVTPTNPSGWTSEANNFAKSRLQVSVRLCLKLVSKRQDVLYVDWVDPATYEASLCSDMVKSGFAHCLGSEGMSPTRSRSSSASSQRPSPSRRVDDVTSGNVQGRSPSISSSSSRSSRNSMPSPQESAISSANLPPFKETFQVIVTHITSPGSFAVQIADFEMACKVAELGKNMTAHYRSAQNPSFSPAANQLCAAHFTGNDEWYRGWIESISSDNMAHIYYPDYGNSEDLHVSRLQLLEAQFTSLPFTSLPCSIAHVVPPDQGEWKQEAIDVFTSSIPLYHPINVKLVFRKRDRLFLDITDPNNNSTTLSKTFVERGLAVWMVSKRQNKEATPEFQGRSKYEESNRVSFVPDNRSADSQAHSQVFDAHGVSNLPNPAQEIPTPMMNKFNPTNQGRLQSQEFGAHVVHNLHNPAQEIPAPMMNKFNPTNQGRLQSQVHNLPNSGEEIPALMSIDPYLTNQGRTQSQVFGVHGVDNPPNQIQEAQISTHPMSTNKYFLRSLPMVAFPINEFFNAMVCDIKITGAVSMQVLTQELKDLDPLCRRIGNHCSQVDHSPYCPIEGELCLVCFSQDKNWYRAVVNGVLPNNQYQVTFVDFGNDDTISPNDIRKVEPEFLRLPRQAYTGILAGLPRSRMGVMLEDDVVRALSAKLLEKRVFARVNGSTNEVEFFDVGLDDKTARSINQELL